MESLPGSALFVGGKRNRHDPNWCCDESDLELSKKLSKKQRSFLYWPCGELGLGLSIKHSFQNYIERVLVERQLRLARLRWCPEFGEALEPKIFYACWEESDWNECLGEGFFENMYRMHIKGLLTEQEYFLRPFHDEESIRMFTKPPLEKMPRCVPFLEKMPRGVPMLLQMRQRMRMLEEELEKRERCLSARQRKPLERRPRLRNALRKVLRMEKRERLDMERLSSMLRFIRNNIFTATASAEGIHIKIIERHHSIYYSAKYRSVPVRCGSVNSIKRTSTTISWMVATTAPPNTKGNDDHRSVYETELDDQFVHVVDGVHLPVRTAGAVVTRGPVLPETSLVPVSRCFKLYFRMLRLLRHGDRLDMLEMKELTEQIQADQCSYNTRSAFIYLNGLFIYGTRGIDKTTLLSQLLPTVKHMMSVRHPLIQMVLCARKRFQDMSSSINFMGPKNMFALARRLCSFALANIYGAEWASAKLKPESLYAGMGSESVLRENIGTSNKLTENEAQRHSAPDSRGAEHGVKAVTTKIRSASWVVATAAPHHATGNRDLLQGFVTEHDDQFVHAVDGVPMPVKARGAVVTDAVVLPDVWFVPGLKSNMVSVSQLAELGYSVGFGCGESCIRSAGDGKIVGKARLGKDGLYKLDFLMVSLGI